MKVLLDENLPTDLRHYLPGHEVVTVAFLGWKGLRNGALLANAAASSLDVLVTKDAGFEYQQNPTALPVAVVVLRCASNAIEDVRPLVPALLRCLDNLTPRSLHRIPE